MPAAARIGDMHTCPMVDPGPKPHVGGPVVGPGCPTVLIGHQPAARAGDNAACASAPDLIAQGSPTVLIGFQPAARIGDRTAHGGVVVAGFAAVIVGGGSSHWPSAMTDSTGGSQPLAVGQTTLMVEEPGIEEPLISPLDLLGPGLARGLLLLFRKFARPLVHGVMRLFTRQTAASARKEHIQLASNRAGITDKIARQMGPRGWTDQQIAEAIKSGQKIRTINKATGNPSIRHIHPQTGKSVVVDSVTNEVIHVGGPGFKYGPASGDIP